MSNRSVNGSNQRMALSDVIGKKLAYMLRHGAIKEGLDVKDDGYVVLDHLLEHPLFANFTRQEVLSEIQNDGKKRFQLRGAETQLEVRAQYGRKFEKSPYHEGTKVKRLVEILIIFIGRHITLYDFDDFPDGYLVSLIIKRLKFQSILTNKILRRLFCPAISHLDLCNSVVNEATLTLIPKKCPNVTWLSFRGLGYVITNRVLAAVLEGLDCLESLNLFGCCHLTNSCLRDILKCASTLRHLNLSFTFPLIQEDVVRLVTGLEHLEELNVYDYVCDEETWNWVASQKPPDFKFLINYGGVFPNDQHFIESRWEVRDVE